MTTRSRLAKAVANPLAVFCAQVRDFGSGRHQPWRVFSDFCELATLSLSQALERQPEREARYLQIVQAYTADEAQGMAALLGLVVMGLDVPEPDDFLGKAFMRLELNDHWKGQFFSPMPIARAMAEMNVHDIGTAPGILTAHDPACGGGVMLIALANALRARNVNYQQRLHVTAQDLDPTAAHMCFIQLALLHVPAVVIIGDSLLPADVPGARCEVYYTPAHHLGLWPLKLKRHAAERAAAAETPAVSVPEAPPVQPVAPSRPSRRRRDGHVQLPFTFTPTSTEAR